MRKHTAQYLAGFTLGMLFIIIVCILTRNSHTYTYSGDAEWEPFTMNVWVEETNFKVYAIQPKESSIKCYFAGSDTTQFKTCTNRN